MFNTNIYIITP